MFTIGIKLVRKQDEFDAVQALREFPTAQRSAFAAVGKHHVETIIPRHFKSGARKRYNHTPRKLAYQRRKFKVIRNATKDIEGRQVSRGELVDLVYTGNLRREAIEQSVYSATAQQGRVNLRGRILNIGKPPYSNVDMRQEMTFMPTDELEEVERIFTRTLAAGLTKRRISSKNGIRAGRPAKPTRAT